VPRELAYGARRAAVRWLMDATLLIGAHRDQCDCASVSRQPAGRLRLVSAA
jgi:hypothetical protein